MTTEVKFEVYGKTKQELNEAANKILADLLGEPEGKHFAFDLDVRASRYAQQNEVPLMWVGFVSWRLTT
jgi:hypothetical protein